MLDETHRPVTEAGWSVRELTSTLSFTGQAAVVVERWSIIAETTLDELVIATSGDDVAQDKIDLCGADLSPDPTPVRFGRRTFGIRLPAPLLEGDRANFELTLSLPAPAARLRRHLVIPEVRCQVLTLRVRFPRHWAPREVTRIDGHPPSPATRGAGDGGRTSTVSVDLFREVRTQFRDLEPGAAYGVAW